MNILKKLLFAASIINALGTLEAAFTSSAAASASSSSLDSVDVDYEATLPTVLINEIKNLSISPSVSAILRETFIAHENNPGTTLSARITPDGKNIITSAYDHYVQIWDIASGELKHTIIDQEDNDNVHLVAISKNSESIATRSGANNIKIWHVASGTLQDIIAVIDTNILAESFHIIIPSTITASPDRQYIITGSSFGEIKIYEAHGRPMEQHGLLENPWLISKRNHTAIQSTAMSPDNRFILATSWLEPEVSIYPIFSGLEKLLENVSLSGVQLLNKIADEDTGTARHPLTQEEQIDFDALPQNIRDLVRKNVPLYEAPSWISYFTKKAYNAYDFISTHKKIIGCVAIASALGYAWQSYKK